MPCEEGAGCTPPTHAMPTSFGGVIATDADAMVNAGQVMSCRE
jgi:hypothetical protein